MHHAEPFIVARQVFSFLAYNFSEPFRNLETIDVVAINPPRVPND